MAALNAVQNDSIVSSNSSLINSDPQSYIDALFKVSGPFSSGYSGQSSVCKKKELSPARKSAIGSHSSNNISSNSSDANDELDEYKAIPVVVPSDSR